MVVVLGITLFSPFEIAVEACLCKICDKLRKENDQSRATNTIISVQFSHQMRVNKAKISNTQV